MPLNPAIFEETVANETERLGQAMNNELNAKLKTLETVFMKISKDLNILNENYIEKVNEAEIDSETHVIYSKNGDSTPPTPVPEDEDIDKDINEDIEDSYNLYGLLNFSPNK